MIHHPLALGLDSVDFDPETLDFEVLRLHRVVNHSALEADECGNPFPYDCHSAGIYLGVHRLGQCQFIATDEHSSQIIYCNHDAAANSGFCVSHRKSGRERTNKRVERYNIKYDRLRGSKIALLDLAVMVAGNDRM